MCLSIYSSYQKDVHKDYPFTKLSYHQPTGPADENPEARNAFGEKSCTADEDEINKHVEPKRDLTISSITFAKNKASSMVDRKHNVLYLRRDSKQTCLLRRKWSKNVHWSIYALLYSPKDLGYIILPYNELLNTWCWPNQKIVQYKKVI